MPGNFPGKILPSPFDPDQPILRALGFMLIAVLLLWLVAEIGVRFYLEAPLDADFYGSIPLDLVPERQAAYGLKTNRGPGWIHLGWIANPEDEAYQVRKQIDGTWQEVGHPKFGSYLEHGIGGRYQVWVQTRGENQKLLGEVELTTRAYTPALYVPQQPGPWQTLFKPSRSGWYINDHTIYRDGQGNWRLAGITSKTNGDFNAETYFAIGVSGDFPPAAGMTEDMPIAEFGELAWAPYVIHDQDRYFMFWSPHKLHEMDSPDGVRWENHRVTMQAPYHKFFRDPMVLQVAEDQWLLYTTARSAYYSQIDVYQSFNLVEWQYIRTALGSGWGSERNAPFSSMESPFVLQKDGRYYLSLTYNNDSFFWPGVLMLFHIWMDPASYNDTLVFHSDNPYDFGTYRGRESSPTLLTSLQAHAPEWIYLAEQDQWYITTAGWPWVSTLTAGEVAVAPIEWKR